MKRARLIIKEVHITKQGEIKNFQIKLPKNVKRIIAIETDVRLDARTKESGDVRPVPQIETKNRISIDKRRVPYLSWTQEHNPVMGKLKLKSMERTYIFFEEWLHFIFFNGGIPEMSMGLFKRSPISLNRNRKAKTVEVPIETTIVKGIYEDSIGKYLRRDFAYTVKVFVWVETEEDADGVEFDFQQEETKNEK